MKVISIGRDEDCTIVFQDNVISRRHAILKIHATGKMEIVDMGQNGTFVNGVKLNPNTPYPVSRKDVVSFAHVRQLDWSLVPNQFKYYWYILIVCVLAVIITGVGILLSHMGRETDEEKLPRLDDKSANEVTVPVKEETKEKTDDPTGGDKSIEMDGKDKVIPPGFFREKKEKEKGKEKKKPEKDGKKNPQDSKEKENDNNNHIIM